MKILAIDTSFDDTAAAILNGPFNVLSNIVCSQLDAHQSYGGVVPEIASRLHVERIIQTIDQALERAKLDLDDIEAIAVTDRPGLLGSLLVGLDAAKSIAFARQLPLVCVHHIEAHLYSLFLGRPDLEPPLICLVASGGHTSLVYLKKHGQMTVLGKTRDDAAGEAFDKVARASGLGMPGGPALSKLAEQGDIKALPMPKLRVGELDFSFSGIKTHAARLLNDGSPPEHVAAGFQHSVVETMVDRLRRSARKNKIKAIGLGGGVAANKALRQATMEMAEKENITCIIPPFEYCTDNAAMIGCLGHFMLEAGIRSGFDTDARSVAQIGEISFQWPKYDRRVN